jgi:hypothetical protein
MVQLSANRCSCIAILWVSLVSFAAITLCVASQQVFIVVGVISLWLSPETFGYTVVLLLTLFKHSISWAPRSEKWWATFVHGRQLSNLKTLCGPQVTWWQGKPRYFKWILRGPFEKFVDSSYYSESELCGGAVTVFFEVLPLARDALLTTLYPLLENVLQTVCHKFHEDSGTGDFDLSRSFLRL